MRLLAVGLPLWSGCLSSTYPGDLLRLHSKSARLVELDAKKLIPATVGVSEESAVASLSPEGKLIFAAIRATEKEFELHPLWWTAREGGLVYESYRYAEPRAHMGQIRLSVDWRQRTIQVYEHGGEGKSAQTKAFVRELEERIRQSDREATISREEVPVRIKAPIFN